MTSVRGHGDIVPGCRATMQFSLETFADDAGRATDRGRFAGLELMIDPVEQMNGTAIVRCLRCGWT